MRQYASVITDAASKNGRPRKKNKRYHPDPKLVSTLHRLQDLKEAADTEIQASIYASAACKLRRTLTRARFKAQCAETLNTGKSFPGSNKPKSWKGTLKTSDGL
eukprot:10288620-Lingulodinium_polyedra.AAC.1